MPKSGEIEQLESVAFARFRETTTSAWAQFRRSMDALIVFDETLQKTGSKMKAYRALFKAHAKISLELQKATEAQWNVLCLALQKIHCPGAR